MSESKDDLLVLTKNSTPSESSRELLTIDLFYHTKGNEYTRVNLMLEGRNIDQLRKVLLTEMPEHKAKEIADELSAKLVSEKLSQDE